MAYFYYDARIPDDKFTPKEHTQDELDAMLIPMDRRDGCKDFYAEFKKCIAVQHQTNSSMMTVPLDAYDDCVVRRSVLLDFSVSQYSLSRSKETI